MFSPRSSKKLCRSKEIQAQAIAVPPDVANERAVVCVFESERAAIGQIYIRRNSSRSF